mmetsp:Transcript_9159/g.31614  ORF Transcript_9159/g.31614 Transcript_9159/m.31614 type:complete len:287 (+) Transcript_9159:956-1816(+)
MVPEHGFVLRDLLCHPDLLQGAARQRVRRGVRVLRLGGARNSRGVLGRRRGGQEGRPHRGVLRVRRGHRAALPQRLPSLRRPRDIGSVLQGLRDGVHHGPLPVPPGGVPDPGQERGTGAGKRVLQGGGNLSELPQLQVGDPGERGGRDRGLRRLSRGLGRAGLPAADRDEGTLLGRPQDDDCVTFCSCCISNSLSGLQFVRFFLEPTGKTYTELGEVGHDSSVARLYVRANLARIPPPSCHFVVVGSCLWDVHQQSVHFSVVVEVTSSSSRFSSLARWSSSLALPS